MDNNGNKKITKEKSIESQSTNKINQNPKNIITSNNQNNKVKENSGDMMTIEQENEYKNRIEQLEKDLELEREKAQIKQNEPNLILDLKNEIISKNKEIKKYATINTKQRDQLEKLSRDIDSKISKMNYKAVTRNAQNENKKLNEAKFKKNCSEQDAIENNISAKEKQLKNIMSLIEILQKENEKLKMKLDNSKNTEQKLKLIDGQKEQERQLNLLNNDIKQKKIQLKEHSKCLSIKNDLLNKINIIKDEITLNHEKLTSIQKKYEDLENKYKLGQNKSKISNSKENKYGNKFRTKLQSYIVPKQKPTNVLKEDDMITVPPKIGEMFTEKELKAIFIAMGKNKNKYETLLKRFNIQNTYVDSLETKHKLDIKKKLNKINELDEQIEFMNVKKGEYNANIQLFKKQIGEAQEEKKLYNMKINALIVEISKNNKINSRKDKEIKLLGEQLIKIRKYLKNGDLEKIQNEPEIELQRDEENSEMTGPHDVESYLTEKTEFSENNVNNLNNVKVDKNNNTNNSENNNYKSDDEIKNGKNEANGIFIDNEDEKKEIKENNEKSNNEENDGDNILSANNEVSNSGENKSSISPEEDD